MDVQAERPAVEHAAVIAGKAVPARYLQLGEQFFEVLHLCIGHQACRLVPPHLALQDHGGAVFLHAPVDLIAGPAPHHHARFAEAEAFERVLARRTRSAAGVERLVTERAEPCGELRHACRKPAVHPCMPAGPDILQGVVLERKIHVGRGLAVQHRRLEAMPGIHGEIPHLLLQPVQETGTHTGFAFLPAAESGHFFPAVVVPVHMVIHHAAGRGYLPAHVFDLFRGRCLQLSEARLEELRQSVLHGDAALVHAIVRACQAYFPGGFPFFLRLEYQHHAPAAVLSPFLVRYLIAGLFVDGHVPVGKIQPGDESVQVFPHALRHGADEIGAHVIPVAHEDRYLSARQRKAQVRVVSRRRDLLAVAGPVLHVAQRSRAGSLRQGEQHRHREPQEGKACAAADDAGKFHKSLLMRPP